MIVKTVMQKLNSSKLYYTFASRNVKESLLMKRIFTLAIISFLVFAGTAFAQKAAVKTNALYWATATPNVGLEFAMAPRWTVEIAGGYNPWTLNKEDNVKAKHFLVTPEIRYWFCEAFQGHYIGINGNYTQFNVSGIYVPDVFYKHSQGAKFLDDLQYARSQGWAAGAGINYGYAFPIARRWNMEFTIGLGFWYTEYDKYESRKCGLFQENVSRYALGPTDLGITFIYMIK